MEDAALVPGAEQGLSEGHLLSTSPAPFLPQLLPQAVGPASSALSTGVASGPQVLQSEMAFSSDQCSSLVKPRPGWEMPKGLSLLVRAVMPTALSKSQVMAVETCLGPNCVVWKLEKRTQLKVG